MQEALHDIIESLPIDFIEEVKACMDVSILLEMRFKTSCKNRVAVIDARIENINYLVS